MTISAKFEADRLPPRSKTGRISAGIILKIFVLWTHFYAIADRAGHGLLSEGSRKPALRDEGCLVWGQKPLKKQSDVTK